MSNPYASPPTDNGRWDFLEDTYWYVPTPYLPAVVLVNVDPPVTPAVVDQTLWHIETVENGYIIAKVATNLGDGWGYSTLVGSITPSGAVSFGFTPTNPDSEVTIGIGSMRKSEGAWFFEMQMTTGSGAANISHWAYMGETRPGDRSWDSLPGYPQTGVEAAFDEATSNDGDTTPLQLIIGTNGDDVLPAAGTGPGLLLFGIGGDDILSGSSETDGLDGGGGNDTATGSGGADDLYGESGRDTLNGGKGDDYLDGGNGRDALTGGAEGDLLHGGNGADRFILASAGQSAPDAPDTIADFKAGRDLMDLQQIDARADASGNNAFVFIGAHAFTGQEGELRYESSGSDTIVEGDTNGDGAADLAIVLSGAYVLTASDFLL